MIWLTQVDLSTELDDDFASCVLIFGVMSSCLHVITPPPLICMLIVKQVDLSTELDDDFAVDSEPLQGSSASVNAMGADGAKVQLLQ